MGKNHSDVFWEIFGSLRENGLTLVGSDKVNHGWVTELKIDELDGVKPFKVRYKTLKDSVDGDPDVKDFVRQFSKAVQKIDTDDAAVQVFLCAKKNKQPISLLTAINSAKSSKHQLSVFSGKIEKMVARV